MEAVEYQDIPAFGTLNLMRLWVRRPRSIGAIAPSSGCLALAIAREVDFELPGVVVELGGGTGSITEALEKGVADSHDIVVIEREASLCAFLSARFPGIRVLHGDARNLEGLLEKAGVDRVKAIVSGLPLLSMPGPERLEIFSQSFAVLPRNGVFVQFTYGLAAPVRHLTAEKIGIVGHRSGWILRNLPPAALWLYKHRAADSVGLSTPIM